MVRGKVWNYLVIFIIDILNNPVPTPAPRPWPVLARAAVILFVTISNIHNEVSSQQESQQCVKLNWIVYPISQRRQYKHGLWCRHQTLHSPTWGWRWGRPAGACTPPPSAWCRGPAWGRGRGRGGWARPRPSGPAPPSAAPARPPPAASRRCSEGRGTAGSLQHAHGIDLVVSWASMSSEYPWYEPVSEYSWRDEPR